MSTLNKKNTFNIVNFFKSTTYEDKKSMDCVPSTWISFDPENQELVAKFMPPPYTKKKSNVLHDLVKNNNIPLEKWPQYPIKILESAGRVILIKKLTQKYDICNGIIYFRNLYRGFIKNGETNRRRF